MDEAEVPQGLYLFRKMYLLNESQRASGQLVGCLTTSWLSLEDMVWFWCSEREKSIPGHFVA